MWMFKTRTMLTAALMSTALLLQACGNDSQSTDKPEIKPAPKLTNDATTYANAAWQLINKVDPLGQPARKLSTDWRINVKMTDSVTEGKYALCRKALTSLEIWARTVIDNGSSLEQKQADYERDKLQCQNAIDNPELGNTDPKQKGTAIANMQ